MSLILALCSCAPVTIETSPSGAEVYSADGQTLLGTTPYTTKVWISEKDLVVRQNRYFDDPVKLNYDSSEKIELKLRPTPVVVYSKPVAEIYPVGSETAIGSSPAKIPVGDAPAAYVLKVADYYDQEISVGIDSPDPLVVQLARRPIVNISATPDGVEIYENDALIGTAPIREEILTSRTFEFRKKNYFAKTLTLNGAPPYEMSVELKPFPVITVTAEPAVAKISHDSELLGKGSVKLAVGGKSTLEVSADRYYPQTVVLTPESDAQVDVALKAMPYVMINSDPAGAEVLLDGKLIGTTPLEQLIEKETVVELSKEGFITQTATLNGKDAHPVIALKAIPPPPVVTISSSPTGAEVSVDGKPIGNTPVKQVVEKPISVVLTLKGYFAQTNTLDGSNLTPMITLEKKTLLENLRDKGISLPLIGGIAAAIIAVIVAIIILLKKKKTA
ncbi:MAG: PEGA domain-containing protein [Kiritimatiellales bacterium]|nr:PEGA domain-containing protein [Kiritimatiellales bacterium]